jgi:hypothetical protein
MPLYHFQLGIPASTRAQIKPLFGLRYSPHAREEAHNDRYGHVTELPRHFLPRVARVIEAETDDKGNLTKVLARQQYDANDDVVYAVDVASKVVKTVWRNSRNDTHRTLDRAKYDLP